MHWEFLAKHIPYKCWEMNCTKIQVFHLSKIFHGKLKFQWQVEALDKISLIRNTPKNQDTPVPIKE